MNALAPANDNGLVERIVSDFTEDGFRIVLAHDGSLIQDLWGEGRRHPRALPPQLLADFSEHADAIGRWLEEEERCDVGPTGDARRRAIDCGQTSASAQLSSQHLRAEGE
jgi:hypothetical protein